MIINYDFSENAALEEFPGEVQSNLPLGLASELVRSNLM
jgi:hypothetical protein